MFIHLHKYSVMPYIAKVKRAILYLKTEYLFRIKKQVPEKEADMNGMKRAFI